MVQDMDDDDQAVSVYNNELMHYVSQVQDAMRLDQPECSAHCVSAICGSEVSIDLILDDQNNITDIGYEISACALTKTVMAIVLKHALGQNKHGIAQGLDSLNALLEHGTPAQGIWSELNILDPARSYTARHNSMRLPFEAILKALI